MLSILQDQTSNNIFWDLSQKDLIIREWLSRWYTSWEIWNIIESDSTRRVRAREGTSL